MLINEYLKRLEAKFEEKYNRLAIMEIIDNYYQYKDYIKLSLAQLKTMLKTNDYDSYFKGDEPETSANVKEALMFLRAFIKAYLKDNENKKLYLKSIEFAKCYLDYKQISQILRNEHKNGKQNIIIEPNLITIREYIYGCPFTSITQLAFVERNRKDCLNKISSLAANSLKYCYNALRFDDESLEEGHICGIKSHSFHLYKFDFGNNVIPIYTTKMGSDPYYEIRNCIYNGLIDSFRNSQLVNQIFN